MLMGGVPWVFPHGTPPIGVWCCVGLKPLSPLRVRNGRFWCIFRAQRRCRFQWSLVVDEPWCCWSQCRRVSACCARNLSPCSARCGCEREKVRPAAVFRRVGAKKFAQRTQNTPNSAFLRRAGRVLSRKCRRRGRVGRVLSRRGPGGRTHLQAFSTLQCAAEARTTARTRSQHEERPISTPRR